MADHIKLGGNDPMDSMFTTNHTVDLTRNAKVPEESVGLSSLGADIETPAPIATKPRGEVIHAKMSDNVQAFDPTTLIPRTEKKDEGAIEVFAELDMAIQREKESITARHEALKEQMYEDFLEAETEREMTDATSNVTSNSAATASKFISDDSDDDDDDMEYGSDEVAKNYKIPETESDDIIEKHVAKKVIVPEDVKASTVSIKKTINDEIEIDEDELNEDLDDSEEKRAEAIKKEEEEMNDIVEGLKAAAKKSIRPTMNTIDLSKFKISNKGQKISSIAIEKQEESIADWVMYDSGYSIAMSGLTGPELLKLDPDNSNRNRLNTMKDIHKIIYDHVVDSKKVGFEQWMKQTRYSDIDNIYFALYMATFHGSNFVSYQCPDCKEVFIKDIDFKDMVKFKNSDVEAKVKEMMMKSTDNGAIEYDVELIQVSDKYVFGMKSPSLYNVIIETAGLPDNVLEKYADLIDTITYIDSVYTIDRVNMQLDPVIIPVVKDDPVKSTVKKIKSMYTLLKNLKSDEYYMLRGYIAKQTEKSADISYLIPEAKCPNCDKVIPANDETSAASLLFTRHHLGAFANM